MIGRSALHYVRCLVGLDEPRTQTTAAERDLLASFLPGAKRIVEIGVFEGFTTRLLAERSDEDAVIYGVDPFLVGRLGISWGERIARWHNRRQIADGKLRLVRKLSTDVGAEVPATVDLVFLDGDHSLAGIRADWIFWRERLVIGGIIALHDTLVTPDRPAGYTLGSIEYFNEFIRYDPGFNVVVQQHSLSILRKRK